MLYNILKLSLLPIFISFMCMIIPLSKSFTAFNRVITFYVIMPSYLFIVFYFFMRTTLEISVLRCAFTC